MSTRENEGIEGERRTRTPVPFRVVEEERQDPVLLHPTLALLPVLDDHRTYCRDNRVSSAQGKGERKREGTHSEITTELVLKYLFAKLQIRSIAFLLTGASRPYLCANRSRSSSYGPGGAGK